MKDILVRPDATVLSRGDGEVQIGTDPRWAVRLVGLSPTEESWVRTLRPGTTPPTPPAEAEDVAGALGEAMVLVPRLRPRSAIAHGVAGGAADVKVLSALRPDGAGQRTLEDRARQTVAISGLGRVGAALALTLATAGVGEIVLDDRRVVLPTDVGVGGYRSSDVGTSRDAALRREIAALTPATVTDGTRDPDVVVLIEDRVATARRALGLLGAGVPHLSVVVREADIEVGPFVVPGRTPCLGCMDLHRADADPAWPVISEQLRALPEMAQETVLAATAAAITAGQVLAALDGAMPRSATARIGILAPDAMPRLTATTPHPACGCVP